jgi:hypothetical protein
MAVPQNATRGVLVGMALLAMSACSQLGSLGSVLGGLGGSGGKEVDGTIQEVDARSQQLSIQQSNGQTVSLGFDNSTRVVYQNRRYPVTALEYGDQVAARVQQTNNGAYYTDSVQVIQSASGSTTGSGSTNVQSLQGTVLSVDRNNGVFTIDAGNGVTLTVSMPYRANQSDVNTFNNLRSRDYVRFYGVYLSNNRVELRQFY